MPNPVEIQLGDHLIPVYAQRHAYLANKLGKFINEFTQSGNELTSENIVSFGQETIYELLCIVIPQLAKRMPEYEFRGYASKQAWEAGEYDPEQDRSPTLPEIENAVQVVGEVNRFNIIKHLAKVVDPDLLKGLVSQQIAGQILKTSPNSPSMNGASEQTTSGMTPPTSMGNTD